MTQSSQQDQDQAKKWRKKIRDEQARQVKSSQSMDGRSNAGNPPRFHGDMARRTSSDESLLFHLENYYADDFCRPWTPENVFLIKQLQEVIQSGGLTAIERISGQGTTSILSRAGLWAMLTGRRQYVVLMGRTSHASERMLCTPQMQILKNPKLRTDYGSELHCFTQLNAAGCRAESQHCSGQRTGVRWTRKEISSGYVAGRKLNDAMMTTLGILSSLKGHHRHLLDGSVVRPDLVLIDCPQTSVSARSVSQSKQRFETLVKDVPDLGGINRKMAALCASPILESGDAIDQLLDRKKAPEWKGVRRGQAGADA